MVTWSGITGDDIEITKYLNIASIDKEIPKNMFYDGNVFYNRLS